MIKLILSLILSVSVLSSSIFIKQLLPNNTSGLCLDGSPAAHYISRGSGANRTKFLFYFEGGFTCVGKDLGTTLDTCYERSQSDDGSSKYLDPDFDASKSGILSGDPAINPNFYDWTRFIFTYCDGTVYQGTRQLPIEYKGTKLYFRGHNITVQRLQAINTEFEILTNATQILLTGSEDGGIAALQWADALKLSSSARVNIIIDSSILLDVQNPTTGQFHYRQIYKYLTSIVNVQVDVPSSSCVAQYPNQLWRCFFYEYIYSYIAQPIFTADTLYDQQSFGFTLGIDCVDSFGSLAQCSSAQRNLIEDYKNKVRTVLLAASSRKNNGAWAPACVNYDIIIRSIWNSDIYRVPENSIYTCENAVGRWFLREADNHTHIDEVSWPNNGPCSGRRTLRMD